MHDDVYNDFNTQSSTHWDGLTHYGSMQCQCFYNGVTPEQITALPGTRNGIQAWARRGIAGRAVLLDYGRWAEAQGLQPAAGERTPVPAADLMQVADTQGTRFETGDIFIVRYGWTSWYERLDADERRAISKGPTNVYRHRAGSDTFRFLWDNHFAAVWRVTHRALRRGRPIHRRERCIRRCCRFGACRSAKCSIWKRWRTTAHAMACTSSF